MLYLDAPGGHHGFTSLAGGTPSTDGKKDTMESNTSAFPSGSLRFLVPINIPNQGYTSKV